MLQKDKETAVLKVNYKHQIMLNIELERIEKYRRTYENSHNFEVAVIQTRRSKILRRQSELRRVKVEMVKRAVDLKSGGGSRIESAQRQNCSVEILEIMKSDLTKMKLPSTNKSGYLSQLQTGYTQTKHNRTTTERKITESSFAFNRLDINGPTETHDASSMARAQTNETHVDETRTESQTERCSVIQFPGLTSPSTRPARLQHDPHGPEDNASRNRPINSSKVPLTCYRNLTHRRSTHRGPVVDMSPFDVFRHKLKESEERSCMCKLPSRSISAVEALRRGDVTSEVAMLYRRTRSAVIQ